ncbi:hypothetical protein [Actinoallomurus sp. NPDC052274]|uniref:hypothetical protein n=1 Tax=Actinoallomurus sp. NPDC052274 TaxID=3155420 RepID=UPI00341897ED
MTLDLLAQTTARLIIDAQIDAGRAFAQMTGSKTLKEFDRYLEEHSEAMERIADARLLLREGGYCLWCYKHRDAPHSDDTRYVHTATLNRVGISFMCPEPTPANA